MKAGLIGHPSVGYADLTPTGRLVRQQTLRAKHVQIDGDYSAAPIPEGVLRLISRFTDDGYLHARSADSKAHIEIATALGIVAPTWPPRRLALTAKGQALRQAALWTVPIEGDVYDDDIEDAVVEKPEEPVTMVGRPLSIFGGAPAAKPAADVAEKPAGPRRGRKPGSKNKPKPAPVSVRGPDAVEANVAKTARVMTALPKTDLAEPFASTVKGIAKAAKAIGDKVDVTVEAERARALAAKIKRWTTTTRR